jgi:hypothetical protein
MTENASTAVADDKARETVAESPGESEDDLDRLLNEYKASHETETPADTPPDTEGKQPAVDGNELSRFKDVADYVEHQRHRSEMDGLVKSVKGGNDALSGLTDAWIEGRLEVEARNDPRVRQAWSQRAKDPTNWGRVLDGIGKKIAKEIAPAADGQLSKDREAAQASVRNRSNQPPAEPGVKNDDLCKLSDSEFFDKYPIGG